MYVRVCLACGIGMWASACTFTLTCRIQSKRLTDKLFDNVGLRCDVWHVDMVGEVPVDERQRRPVDASFAMNHDLRMDVNVIRIHACMLCARVNVP